MCPYINTDNRRKKTECEWVSANVYSYVCLIRVLLIWRARENEESIVINWTNSSWWWRKRHWQRMLLGWYDQRSIIVTSTAVRSSVHTYPIIEITVALNAHRVSLMHRNRLRVLTDYSNSTTAINFFFCVDEHEALYQQPINQYYCIFSSRYINR
jgi:hypothetical protein